MRRCQLVIDDTGSVEGIYAFIYCTKWRSGQVLPMPHWLTDSQTLKDRATQLLTKYKSGALVTQKQQTISVSQIESLLDASVGLIFVCSLVKPFLFRNTHAGEIKKHRQSLLPGTLCLRTNLLWYSCSRLFAWWYRGFLTDKIPYLWMV